MVGHSPVFHILLQIEVSVLIIFSYSAGMLSTPGDFFIFSSLNTDSISSHRLGRYSLPGVCGQSSSIGSTSVS